MNETEKTPKLTTLRRVLAVLLVICLLVTLLCFATPVTRKKRDISTAGGALEQTLALIPAMLSYYDGSSLAALAENPSNSISALRAANTLNALGEAGGFDAAMFVVRRDKQYVCAADSLFETGKNAYSPGSLLSLDKAVARQLDAIYAGSSAGGTVPALVDGREGGNAACVLLPVKSVENELLGVLWVQSSVGDTQYHMLRSLNLYVAGGIFAAVSLVLALLIFGLSKMQGRPPKTPPEAPAGPTGPADPGDPAPQEPAPQPDVFPSSAEEILDAEISPSLALPGEEGGDADAT